MKLILKIVCLSMSILLTTYCVKPTPTTQTLPNPDNTNPDSIRTDAEYEDKRNRDTDRDDVIREMRDRYSGDVCEDLDRKDKEYCEDICNDIYKQRKDRRECEELEIHLIEDLKEVYEALEDGDEDDFRSIDYDLFDTYLNTGISGLDDIIDDYTSREAEEFLLWLIEDRDFAEIFIKEDDDYKVLEALFKQIDKNYNSNSETWAIFSERIGDDDLMETLINEGDEETMEWFFDFINDSNSACKDDTESRECFKVYCNIGSNLQNREQEDWLDDFELLEDYLEDVISDKVNSNQGTPCINDGWTFGEDDKRSSPEIDELDDLDRILNSGNDTWVNVLCKNIAKPGGTYNSGTGTCVLPSSPEVAGLQ